MFHLRIIGEFRMIYYNFTMNSKLVTARLFLADAGRMCLTKVFLLTSFNSLLLQNLGERSIGGR